MKSIIRNLLGSEQDKNCFIFFCWSNRRKTILVDFSNLYNVMQEIIANSQLSQFQMHVSCFKYCAIIEKKNSCNRDAVQYLVYKNTSPPTSKCKTRLPVFSVSWFLLGNWISYKSPVSPHQILCSVIIIQEFFYQMHTY